MVICFLLVVWGAGHFGKAAVFSGGSPEDARQLLFVYELRGQVPREGFYCFDQEQTISALLKASGVGHHIAAAAAGPVRNGSSIWIGDTIEIREIAPAARLNFFLPVSVNAAAAEDLQLVPGLGLHTARTIIAYRDDHGGINDLQELAKLKGIGAKKLAALLPYLTL